MIKRPSTSRLVSLLAGLFLALVTILVYGSLVKPVQAIPIQQTGPTVGFSQSLYLVDEDEGEATITVTISNAPATDEDVQVRYRTLPGSAQEGSGGDYQSTNGTLTFTSSSSTSQTFDVTINDDGVLNEDEETINLDLDLLTPDTGQLGRSSAQIVISDDDEATNTPPPSQATGTRIFVDAAEPNETFNDAYTIAPEAAATTYCRLTLWPIGDIDFYRFSVKAGSYYRVLTDQLSPGLDTVMEIYNSTGGKVGENDDVGGAANVGNRRSEVAFQANADGVYFARVVNKDATDPAGLTYCMQVDEITQPTATASPTLLPTRTGSDPCEPNGRLDLACLIGENQAGNFNFIPPFNEGPDNDFYKLWVRPGITYTCETTALSDVADTNIIFLDANGNDFNPQLGNDNKEINDRGSRLTYFSTYTGYLHILVGPVNPVPLNEASRHTYTLTCTSEVAPTATPTLAPRTPVPVPPGGGGGGTFPTPTSMATPAPSPTPFDFSFLTPSPTVIPIVTIQPLPTATSFAGNQQMATVNTTVYYDSNFNFTPEPTEGIVDIAVFLYDNATGRLIAFGYTNNEGFARFESIATTGAIRVEVPFLNFRQIVGAGESNILLRVAPQPLPIGIP